MTTRAAGYGLRGEVVRLASKIADEAAMWFRLPTHWRKNTRTLDVESISAAVAHQPAGRGRREMSADD
jgi:hypothetical protein